MTDKLPPNLLALFAARPALRYLPHADHAPAERTTTKITGVASYLDELRKEPAPYTPSESWLEARDRKILEKQEKQRRLLTDDFEKLYQPNNDPNIRGDAHRTLFIGRLSYDVTADDLEREFGRYGRIERALVVTNKGLGKEKDGKPQKKKIKSRGYGFVVFETEDEFRRAYKGAERLSIKGRPVIVDAERGRTVPGWRPRRFGGGKGGRGYSKAPAPRSYPGYGYPPGPGSFRGARGGFRGGFDRGGRGFGRGGGFRDGYGGRSQFNGGPDGAPSGPRGSYGGGGFRGGPRGYGGDDSGGFGNANAEPIAPRRPREPRDRERDRDGYRDLDRDRERDRDRYRDRDGDASAGSKRPYDGGGYEESRTRRRY